MQRNQYRLKLPCRHDKTTVKTEVQVTSGSDQQVFRLDHEPVPANRPINELPRDEILIHTAPDADVTLATRTTSAHLVTTDWVPCGSFFSASNGLTALPIGSTLDIQFAGQIEVEPAPVAPVLFPEESVEKAEEPHEPEAKPKKRKTK